MKGITRGLLALLLLIVGVVTAVAAEVQLEYTGQSDGFYRYQFASGAGLTCSGQMGTTDNIMMAFSFDTGISWTLFRDDQEIEYASDEIVDKTGSYNLMLTDTASGDTAQFAFSVIAFTMPKNIIDLDDGNGSITFGDVVEQPPMRISYDQKQGMLRYTLPNGASFTSTVSQGGITGSPVQLVCGTGMSVSMWCDDKIVPYSSGDTIVEPGNYRVKLMQGKPNSESKDANTYVVTFTFRLIGPVENISLIAAPEKFYITKAVCNGKPTQVIDHRYLPMDEDGDYAIDFAADSMPVSYTMTLRRDTVAPIIHFSGTAVGGVSNDFVSYAVDDPQALVTVYRDGRVIEHTGWLGAKGNYRLVAQDAAGNTRSYLLRIDIADYSLVVILTVIFAAAIILIVVTYIVTRRRGLRVI